MKELYTQNTLNEFFEEFKKLPISYKIEQVHQLLNNPNAKATHKVNRYFKHLKLIIMTSFLIVSLTALLLTLSNHEEPLNKVDIKQVTKQAPDKHVAFEKFKESETAGDIDKAYLKCNTNPTQLVEGYGSSIENQVVNEPEKAMLSEINSDNEIRSLDWPKDTVLDGRKLFVTLTQDELLKLGIKKSDDVVYYCNVYKNCSSSSTRNPDLVKKIFALDTTHFSFYLDFSCDANFENHHANSFIIDYNKMDTLLPVVLKYGSPKEPSREEICWFTTNKELFEALPERYKYLETTYTELKKLKKDNRTYVNYFDLDKRAQKFNSIAYLQLTDEQLIQLGFQIIHDTVPLAIIKSEQDDLIEKKQNRQSPSSIDPYEKEYSDNKLVERKIFKLLINENDPLYYMYFYKLEFDKGIYSYKSGSSLRVLKVSENTEIPIPILITDTLGRNYGEIYSTEQSSKRNIDLNTLLPVKIDIDDYNYTEMVEVKQELLFWYKPDANFFNRLPKQLSKDLVEEYSAITNVGVKSQSSCTYFEVCKSTLQLESFKLYPNPANNYATIEFDLNEDTEGDISINNIMGARIKSLISNSTFQAGRNIYQMDLSGITPGIYLITVNTNKGFKTQRVIIST